MRPSDNQSQRLKVESGDWSKTVIGKSKKTEELFMCLVTYKEGEQKTKKLHSSTSNFLFFAIIFSTSKSYS